MKDDRVETLIKEHFPMVSDVRRAVDSISFKTSESMVLRITEQYGPSNPEQLYQVNLYLHTPTNGLGVLVNSRSSVPEASLSSVVTEFIPGF